ncbi:hypothetical protein [Xanthomonas medicagonis]|uniref:hypothetical protein n=1 Tax=Xanthomonas medicagonis TaxID=3160841 RepID=UPI003516BB3E
MTAHSVIYDRYGNVVPDEFDEFGKRKSRVLKDGERISIRMTLMDSTQQAIAAHDDVAAARAQAMADHQEWLRQGGRVCGSNAAANQRTLDASISSARQVQAIADRHQAEAAARESIERSNPAMAAYLDSVEALQAGRQYFQR